MKSLLVTISIIFLLQLGSLFAEKKEVQVAEYDYQWKEENWVMTSMDSLIYNDELNVQTVTSKDLDDNKWTNEGRINYEYPTPSETHVIHQEWSAGWRDFMKQIIKNNANDALESIVNMEFKDGVWLNITKEEFTYFGSQHLQEVDYYSWADGEWVLTANDVYVMTPDDQIQTKVALKYVDGEPVNDFKIEYFYEIDTIAFIVLFSFENDDWKPNWRYKYEFGDNSKDVLTSLANGTEWNNYWLESFMYDEFDNEISSVFMKWIDQDWEEISKDSSDYDGEKPLVEYYYFWENAWVNQAKTEYKYDFISGVEQKRFLAGLKVFPNPTSDEIQLSFLTDATSSVQLSVYDISGRKVINLLPKSYAAGLNTIKANTSSLLPGAYFIVLQNGRSSRTTKFTVK
jgi:type IX secretion system substrate protein